MPGLVIDYSAMLFFPTINAGWHWHFFYRFSCVAVIPLREREARIGQRRWQIRDDANILESFNNSEPELGRIACAAIVLCVAGTLCANTLDLLSRMVTTNLTAPGHASGQTGLGVALVRPATGGK